MYLCEQINGTKRCRKPATVKYRRRHPQTGWKYVCEECDNRMQAAKQKAAEELKVQPNTTERG